MLRCVMCEGNKLSKHPKNTTGLIDEVEEHRWPKSGDRLLRNSDDWNRGVGFSRDHISRHVHIWSGYMSAGAALIDVCEEDPHERHFLIYPILFNYRHGIELAMKWIIVSYVRYASIEVDDIEIHNLWQLWKLCKQIIIEVGSEDESLPAVEQVIKDLHDLDGSALTFRYSCDKNGVLISMPDKLIDLNNIRDVMEGISHFFEGADGQLDANSSAIEW